MRTTKMVAMAIAGTLALGGCGGASGGRGDEGASSNGEYIVERSNEDEIETIRTVSGSKWGGDATLVEELAIGEETGEEPYLFGAVTAAWATADRIYVVDPQVPAVRAYDHDGQYLFDVGRTGQGPGEYRRPVVLAVAADGRVFVTDFMGARLNIYDADGTAIDDWPLGNFQSAMGVFLVADGQIYTRIIDLPADLSYVSLDEAREGVQRVGPDGLTGEPIFAPAIEFTPPTVKVEIFGREAAMPIIPFSPEYQWAFAPGGEMIAGVSADYRFRIQRPDGATTIVEKAWEPVPVDPEEAAFHAEEASAQIQRMVPDWQLDVDLVPASKPAFDEFRPDQSGRVWVVREGPGRPDPECTDAAGDAQFTVAFSGAGDVQVVNPPSSGSSEDREGCWAKTSLFDVFELATGEFLGTVRPAEPGFRTLLFAEGDTILASVIDELGTVRVKKYRLEIE